MNPMNFSKYIFIPLLGIAIAFLSGFLEVSELSKVTVRRLRWALLCFSVAIVLMQGVVTWRDDWAQMTQSERDRSDLQARIDDLKERNIEMRDGLTSTRAELNETRGELSLAHMELAQANSNLMMQSRSIGSLVFNLETSEEGKRRFARCFQDLSLITERRENPLMYDALICKDGVAMFGFEREPERLKQFYFFTESEVNFVLSGTPLEDHFIDADGKVRLRAGSELEIISQIIDSKLPDWSEDELEREKGLAKIDDRMRTVMRYVYRAVSMTTEWWRDRKTNSPHSRRVVFSYAADPLAEKPRILTAEIEIPMSVFRTYYGMPVREFNARIIDLFNANGIEPKVRSKDVRGINARVRGIEDQRTFPYQK